MSLTCHVNSVSPGMNCVHEQCVSCLCLFLDFQNTFFFFLSFFLISKNLSRSVISQGPCVEKVIVSAWVMV